MKCYRAWRWAYVVLVMAAPALWARMVNLLLTPLINAACSFVRAELAS